MYDGEWVDDVPKCGQYMAAPSGSFDGYDNGSGAGDGGASGDAHATTAGFELPQLRLLKPDTVLSDAIANIRQDRAQKV